MALLSKHDKKYPKFFQTTSKTKHKRSSRFLQITSKTRNMILSNYFKNKTKNVPEILQITSKIRHKSSPRFFQTTSKTKGAPEILSNYFKIKIGPRDLQDSFKAMQKQNKGGPRDFFQLLQKENIRDP